VTSNPARFNQPAIGNPMTPRPRKVTFFIKGNSEF
jgi:hypothetical protein